MQVLASKDFRCPIRMYENSSFFHIRDGNMYIVAVTMRNANASLVFHFLLQVLSHPRPACSMASAPHTNPARSEARRTYPL